MQKKYEKTLRWFCKQWKSLFNCPTFCEQKIIIKRLPFVELSLYKGYCMN